MGKIDAKQAETLHRAHVASVEMTHSPSAANEIAALREMVSEFDRIVGEIAILSNPDWTARPDNALDQIHALTGEVIGGILRRRDAILAQQGGEGG